MPAAMSCTSFSVGVGRAAGDERGSRGARQLADVEGRLGVAVRARLGDVALVRGRAGLPAGHAVDGVVEHQRREVDVAAGGMDEMVAADGGAVAVAHDDHHVQRWVGHLGAGGHRQARGRACSARWSSRGRRVMRPAAADARHHRHLVRVELQREQRVDERPGDDAVGAAGAPQRLGRAQVAADLGRAVGRYSRQLPIAPAGALGALRQLKR